MKRLTAVLLLLILGCIFSKALAADIKYHIINNQGKVCFQYVIKDSYTYTSIDKNKLCVHPWARSMVATGFRFYTNKAEAEADAAGTIGSHFEEGDEISVVAPGTTTFYVRYRMKTQDELESEGYVYDPDGNMAYLMQIRERNAKGGKRRQVYYDAETNDNRFEFGWPGSNSTDIPDPDPEIDGGGPENLQTAVPYRFRFDTKGDAYGVYIYNGAAEGQVPNGVLTASGVGRDNNNPTKQKIATYEEIISDYDPETTNKLQTFFFVAPNKYILQESWKGQWEGKVFIVGALGGIDYNMRDVQNKAAGGDEANVPYFLCANGNPDKQGEFTNEAAYPNGYQLQCFRSWRAMDCTIDNAALIKTTPYENTHQVTYHIVNRANTSEDVLTIVQRHGPHSPFNLSNRDKLQRIGCTLSTNYYSNRECTVEHTGLVGEATDVYIPYTFDAATLQTATNVVFSTDKDNPTWLSLTIRESGTKKLVYDANNNVIQSNTNSNATPDATTLALQTAQFAFIGDPYSFQVICKAADGKFAYVNPETLAYNNTANNVCFTDSPTDDQDKFAMVQGTTESSFQIFQRDKFALAYRAFWDARSGGNQIRMYSRTATPEIHADLNLHATLTPTYNYTYNIVDNNGRIAIKYTITQELSRRLDGEHGHKAIPPAIYSPYLEGETLTFYTTLSTLSGAIEQLPAGGGNIYVRYTQTPALLSTRPYPLDNTKSYFMQLGDRYVIYNSGLTSQADRPSIEETGKDNRIWIVTNQDPYDVRVTNTSNNFTLFDNTEIHLIIMSSTAASPAEGQVALLLANGADISEINNSQSIALSGDGVTRAHMDRSATVQQVIFHEAVLERAYRLIDKQGKILLEYSSNELGDDKDKLGVPAEWRSPLIKYAVISTNDDYANSGYKYWVRNNFNISGDTYTLKDGQTPITGPAQSTDGYIYVTYDAITDASDANYVDMNPAFKDIDERVTRSATSSNLDRDASKFGQLYMLKFTSSANYYLEDTGDRVDTKVTPSGSNVYPYTNGDGPIYIRNQSQWENDSEGGASTRTRWPWYILSPNNDPYHVMVTSWQSSHTKSDIVTSYYSYLYTYYNDEINNVITGNITDDPRTIDEEGNRIMPTEYMLLGTKDHYQLVTSEEIGSGGSGYQSTNHQTVTSFEQYWRNNPTVHRTLGVDDGSGPITAAQEETLKSKGWHKYKAWANAAAWSGGTGSSNKSYAYDDHWFLTVNVGSGEFELIPTEIDAVLVLVDNHGWEIMRQPIPKHSETTRYEAAKASLRKWDSPMVNQYKFYGSRYVTHKVNGYHKYNIYDNYNKSDGKWLKSSDLVDTGASLADYPEEYSGSALYDLYVTYTVKPEYAQAYTGAATEGTVNYPYLIRQDGKLAKADNATTLTTIESSSTGIDAGTDTGLSDESLYWYLKPNFEIDTEMGYEYDVREDANDASSHLYTKEETNTRYHSEGASGFDPYNIQIYNKQYSEGYFTTDATAADVVHGQYMATSAPAGDGTVSLSAKNGTEGVFSPKIRTYDGRTLHITNQTFMAVQDANGNMRLMPRFDQAHVIENFTTLKDPATAQPEDDKAHGQSTWLLRPIVYTYYVIDNQGREALRYTLMSSGSPKIPAMFQSPLAKDYKFYATYDGSTLSSLNNEITGAFADATGLTDNKVYVRYTYDPSSDTDALLKGMWYNAKLNGDDVKVTTGGITKETYADDAAHRWRFMQSAGNDRDPYAVTLWNGTPATESNNQRYIIMGHSDGTGYALMKAANESTTDYLFIDGASAPTFVAQSGYTTYGTIDATKKITLTPVLATNSITYKIITHSGKVALTSEAIAVTNESSLVLPEWMESPLMKSDAYIFYSAATEDPAGTFTVQGEPTTTPKSLDGSVVYVRYDYEKSKKAVESFGMPDFDGLPYNYAPLDLTGNVKYTIGITSNNNGRIWNVNTSTLGITETDVKVNTEVTRVARLWQFTGGDPYEVTIQNPSYSTTAVLAGKEPNTSASDSATPNDRYPLTLMKEPNDGTYTLNTFMVLKYNPNEVTAKIGNVDHSAGALKFYVTGNDHLYMAQSNSLAGGVYVYKDDLSYRERLKASGEPMNPKNGTMIIYSSFFYRPVMTYHIITNDGKEALKGYSLMAGTTVEMPKIYQSPLLNSGDFSYYTEATETDGTYTVTESTKTAANTSIATAVAKNAGDIYVRYTYSPSTSPFKIATNIDEAAEDGTRLDWTDEKGLDLSGDPSNPNKGGTWYTMADMQNRFSSDYGNVFGTIDKGAVNSTLTFESKAIKSLPNGRAPSNKKYLWKLMGNDPYAIKIYNAEHGKFLSVKAQNPNSLSMELQDKDANGFYQTFMLLEIHANDNEISDFGKDDEGNYNYQLRRWTSLIASGTKLFASVTTNKDGTNTLTARNWDYNNFNFSNYDIRMSSSNVETRQIINMGSGSTANYCVEFIKAPVTRKYHYHAIQYDGTTRVGETWNAVMEHDWLQPVVLEDNIARLFCKYEMRDTLATDDNVTGTNIFKTRAALETKENPGAQVTNAQFYSNENLTRRVKDNVITGASGQYDVYPEIELDSVYHIYFKYQIDNETTVSGRTLSDITSTPAQIANDKAHYAEAARLDPAYYTGDNHGKWFFMVLDTDAAMTAGGAEDSRTFVGKQYFLRREDNGSVSWMDNSYTLHPQAEDNYNDWPASRVAEWYKKGDNDPYREGRWLWTFVGSDPYNMRVLNLESVVGVKTTAEGVYSLAGADDCWTTIGVDTLSNNAVAFPVTVPTEAPTENQLWGISYGYGSEQTMSLISTAITTEMDNQTVSQPLYWSMLSRTINRVTTQGVEGDTRSSDRTNAIQLIPYEPVKYQDINLVIKRDDHVAEYNSWKAGKTENEKRTKLKELDSGISLLYFTAAERTYVAGDKIDLRTQFSLPINVRRAFCDYTLYKDDYDTEIDENDESTYFYTVTDGPYSTNEQAEDSNGLIYDEDGKPVYTYVDKDGNPASGAQSIYVKYVVTSDIFLKTAPKKEVVETMAQNNDHVYFMDFPTYDAKGNEITHHAFYDPDATTYIQTGDLSKNKDKNTGIWVPERKSWNGSGYTSNTSDPYNATQYRTADDRMVSTPEELKWYFVGDPYKLQVFSTAGEWNTALMTDQNSHNWGIGTKQAQLARFNTVETNFKFVSDCVHIRLPNYEHLDNRKELIPTNEYGVAMPEKSFPNRNNGKPYLNDFYWECVPAASSEAGTFALRFKEDNDLLGYRNVYYYLGRDGKTMIYNSDEEDPVKYHVNLNYRPNNERYESGQYLGYHKANNDSTIIRLVQPVKVYITTNRAADSRYAEQENVTVDEYSGYYGLNETITGVPRHLQRKFVKYNDLTHNGVTSGMHSLTIGNATSHDTPSACSHTIYPATHPSVNAIFKFSVFYNVDDETSNGIHLFTSNVESPTWLDARIGNNSWLYYDKTNVDGSSPAVENKTDMVSNYRRAMHTPKNGGWNNEADGWNDGLKGLHWAFVGDPYDFTILNRRRYEDAGSLNASGQPMWLAAKKQTIANYANVADSVVWAAYMVDNIETYTTNTASGTAGLGDNGTNAHWSVQMMKTGGDADYFLRTASLDKTAANADGTNNSDTDNYWRMMAKQSGTTEFFAEPYSLSDHRRYTNGKGNLNYSNYVNNDMRYTQTMNGLGVYEQRLEIRTAMEEDNDGANNDCFDAKVEIRTKDGTLRISKDNLELKYGISPDMLPYTLRRYGCEYTCYVNYESPTNPGMPLTRLRDSNTPMDETESWSLSTAEYEALADAISTAKSGGKNVTLTYIYEVTDDVAQFFTTASDALTEDYTWANTYFAWDQTYSGTNVEVEYYEDVFDHYVYDSNGQIIDAVYEKVRKTRVVSNPTQAYPTTAFLNTHTNQTNVFADESTQSKDDRQKWALVGDPYVFTLKNYAQYLVNPNATQLLDNGLMTQTTIPVIAQNFAVAIDKDGKTYLAVVNENGEVTTNMSFTFSTSSDKTVKTTGTGVNNNDPTGHTYDTRDVKPFKIASLLSYADIVRYHLVIAHQHSLDPEETYLDLSKADDDSEVTADLGSDEKKIAARKTFKDHLMEYLTYQGIQKDNNKNLYVNQGTIATGTGIQSGKEEDVKTLLKQYASLRDFISYPIADYSVARVGIGNHPQVPWYMKRQFCRYYLYQKDVLRSEPDSLSPYIYEEEGAQYYIWVNESENMRDTLDINDNRHANDSKWYKSLNVKWVTVRDMSYWDKADAPGDGIVQVTAADVTTWNPAPETYTGDRKLTENEYRKKPKYYDDIINLNGKVLDRLQECHYNRMVEIDVVYEVIPEAFQFAYRGRNTTAWYQMMTSSGGTDHMMSFSYKDKIGMKPGRDEHYTNEYLWAPEGDPYGFVVRSRYSTINGNGWNATVVTTPGALPKEGAEYTASETSEDYEATYTDNTAFIARRVIHALKGETVTGGGSAPDDRMSNGIYEMFTGDATLGSTFLMHPTTAYIDTEDPEFSSYYMTRDPETQKVKLKRQSARTLQSDVDANWHMQTTTEQLLPYFERAGYVGGINPASAVADFNYQDYYDRLKASKESGTPLDFTLRRKIEEAVYAGTFTDATGTVIAEGTERANVTLPLTFKGNNLVNLTDGYYRIVGFSTNRLNAAEKANATTGYAGIQGPRYVSGYRFKSETGSAPLHFFETTKDSAKIHTFADLDASTPFTATAPLQGNIELLPADFDASSIFRIKPTGTAAYNKYTLSTQGLNVQVSPGNNATMSTAEGTALRIDNIGGAAVTMRYFEGEPASASWDASVIQNLKTNYLTSNGDSYSISMATDNELNETAETAIQDTKWLLQPVGIHEEWPYNEMPLRVEVNKGGVKNYALTGDELTAPENQDNNYYGTLYVPFDTRLSNTTDAAFTLTSNPTAWGTPETPNKVTMASVSRLNEMGNPQFVPANWPVVLRTSDASNVVTLKNQPEGEAEPYAERHYVNMYIPNVEPTVISGALDEIKLSGQYLEQTLTEGNDKTIMVFGLPFEELASHSSHEYDTDNQVGWFTNDNWARESHPEHKAHLGSYPKTADVATHTERNNKYVYHNKVYYVLNDTYNAPTSSAKFNIAIFDEEFEIEEEEEDMPIDESIGKKHTPWPCNVYDLQGRLIAEDETPQTLRRNNPSLKPGVYIFGTVKVVVR